MIKIVLDTLGGDHSPEANVPGAVMALKDFPDLFVTMVGNEEDLKKRLSAYPYDQSRVDFSNAPEVIGMNEAPTMAVFHQKDSSLIRSLDLLKQDPSYSGLVSLGSSGALLVGAVVKIGKLEGIKRPAFCPLVPTMDHHFVAVCDSGASAECSKEELLQNGIMASLYLKKAYGIANPRVALLNIGTESEKGDTLRREAYPLFEKCPEIHFVGNMESRDLVSGKYDVVACDGFSGNVLLKSTEGMGIELLKLLKKTFYKNLKNKLGALLLKKDVYAIKNFMDYNNYGGAVMLGLNKLVIKGHGSGNEKSVYHCLEQAYKAASNGLIEALTSALKENTPEK
jgi:glycerol-3-phosphate acyltransferase PlsX